MQTETSANTLNQIVLEIEGLKRQSRAAIPFGLIGLALVVGGLVYSSMQLTSVRAQIQTKNRELTQLDNALKAKNAQYAEKRANLEELTRKIPVLESRLAELNQNIASAAQATSATQRNAALAAAQAKASSASSELADATALLADTTAPARYGDYNVDLFYCAQNAERNKPLAEAVYALSQDGRTRGRWRVKVLSEQANNASGYRIRSDVIRFNADEKDMARMLLLDIAGVTSADVSSQQIDYPTPGYLSIFFCAAA